MSYLGDKLRKTPVSDIYARKRLDEAAKTVDRLVEKNEDLVAEVEELKAVIADLSKKES